MRDLATGIQMTATTITSTIDAFGIQGLPNGPMTRFIIHGDAAPPGAARTSRAKPAQTNDIASVTTISGTRVTTTSEPLIAPSTRPRISTPMTTARPYSAL